MKRLVAFLITALILGAILYSVDRGALWANMRLTRWLPFVLAMGMFVPQVAVMSWRWKMMASRFVPMGWSQSVGLILASQTMNIVLPSKMGDLTKGYFLHRSGAMELSAATNLVIFEKMMDVGALCLLALAGIALAVATGIETDDPTLFYSMAGVTAAICLLLLSIVVMLYVVPTDRIAFYAGMVAWLERRPKLAGLHRMLASSHEVMALLQRRSSNRAFLWAISIVLWIFHLLQIYLLFLALNAAVPFPAILSLMPLAIFVGLLPFSLFGMGTRDAAIIFLFSPYHPPEILAGVGLYVSLRYFVPAAAGLPFLNHYLGLSRAMKKESAAANMD